MDTLILLDTKSWKIQESIRDKVVGILYRNQIIREGRAFDDEIYIRHTTDAEHDVILESIAIDVPLVYVKAIVQTNRYNLSSENRNDGRNDF